MPHTVRQGMIVLAALVIAVWAILPPQWLPASMRIGKISLGKDLAGGVTLTYAVAIKPTDPPDTLSKVIEVLKRRVDPAGQMEISMVPQGSDRIEISMPLPSKRVKDLRDAFEAELARVSEDFISAEALRQLAALPPEQRAARAEEMSRGNAERKDLLLKVGAAYDEMVAARSAFDAKQAEVHEQERQLRALEALPADLRDPMMVEGLRRAVEESRKALEALAERAAPAVAAYEGACEAVLSTAVPPRELRAAVQRSNKTHRVRDPGSGKFVELPSPRQEAIDRLKRSHPAAAAGIDRAVAAWERYERERQTLDDPSDLIRILRGAGVLDFRITVKPNSLADETTLRLNVSRLGPRNAGSEQARWYKINKIDGWYNSIAELEELKRAPREYFAARGFVVEPYEGEYYMLCYDVPGSRLTSAEGSWRVTRAYQGVDQVGRPAIDFEMDALGGQKLGDLTGNNVGNNMAVLLDDEVYTAPVLRDRISSRGQISGSFSTAELNYVIQVLAAGSLQAKLSPEPISQNTVGPSLGADNLRAGLVTGVIAFALVAGFMVVYYFGPGVIAVVALVYNLLLVMGVMALNQAAFTVPGIAGIVLTFGQAVDSNVLIYERLREELLRGADMKTAVRLGFQRAVPPIVDGNISNLIICAVLHFFGTQEIRGFAVVLAIGVLATLFSALVLSRLIFTVLMEQFGWRKTSQLPMRFPAVQRLMSPHIDWMKHRHLLLGALAVFLVASAALTWHRGSRLLGTEFVGGTQIDLQFRRDEAAGQPVTMTRAEVKARLVSLAQSVGPDSELRIVEEAEVVPVNPRADGVSSDHFRLRFGHANDKTVIDQITGAFADVTGTLPALSFKGSGASDLRTAPVHPVLSRTLGENIDRPGETGDVSAFVGGVAIVLEGIEPPQPRESIVARLDERRRQPEYSLGLMRTVDVRVLEGTDRAVTGAVILVHDPSVSALDDPDRWEREVASMEWRLVRDALTRPGQPASVQSFSPAIARTFAAQGIVSTVLSLLMLTIYVFARFGTFRWAMAATVPLFADVIGITGLLVVAQLLYESPATSKAAHVLGLLPFKLDLAQIAAMLTIVGYSLNDKIIILDRIRENKGKLPYATYETVNASINQTLSRTIITAGTHMITTIVLYLFGGEAVRGFAYTFNLGVLLGTYTSIVSTPLVWSHTHDLAVKAVAPGAGGAGAPGTGAAGSQSPNGSPGRGAAAAASPPAVDRSRP